MTGRPAAAGWAARLTALGTAAVLAVLLARFPASAGFTATTATEGSTVSSAAEFCAGPGSSAVTAAADTWIQEAAPLSGKGGDKSLYATSESGADVRTLVRFTLPALPGGCAVTDARLRLYAESTTAGRILEVHRLDPATAWTESGANWGNQPATVGTAATATAGSAWTWHEWTVTEIVTAQYALGNNGVLVKDAAEDAPTRAQNRWESRENGNRPQLVVTWG